MTSRQKNKLKMVRACLYADVDSSRGVVILTPLPCFRIFASTDKPTHRPAGVTDEKLVSKALTIYGTLERFGFSKERIEECLASVRNLELDDALEWLTLRCPEKELLFDAANSLSALVAENEPEDESLASGVTTPADFPALPSGAATPAINGSTTSKKVSKKQQQQQTSSAASDPNAVSLAQEDVDAIRDKPTAAYVSARLELLSIQRKLISESTRTTAQLESIVSQSSKAYLFDKRDADAAVTMARGELDDQVRAMRATAKAEEAEKKEKAKEQEQEEEAEKEAAASSKADQDPAAEDGQMDGQGEQPSSDKGDFLRGEPDDPDGLFGNMLDEMPTEEVDESTNTTIKIRSMPLPKQYAGKPPRLLLEDVVRRKDKFAARPVFSLVSSGTRAKRATVSLRWDAGTQQVFTMHEEACPDQAQAYNYVATMALFAIDTGSVGRQLAPAFKELWNELEAAKKEQDEEQYRSYLKQVKSLVDPRLQLPVCLNSNLATSGHGSRLFVKQVQKTKAVGPAVTESDPSRRARPVPAFEASEEIQRDFYERQSRQSYMDMLVRD